MSSQELKDTIQDLPVSFETKSFLISEVESFQHAISLAGETIKQLALDLSEASAKIETKTSKIEALEEAREESYQDHAVTRYENEVTIARLRKELAKRTDLLMIALEKLAYPNETYETFPEDEDDE